MKQEMMGEQWCRLYHMQMQIFAFAPRAGQITMPTPHHAIFLVWMHFLTPNQSCQNTEGNYQNKITITTTTTILRPFYQNKMSKK